MTDDFGGAHPEQIDGVVAVDVGRVGHLQSRSDAAIVTNARQIKTVGIGRRFLAVGAGNFRDAEERFQITGLAAVSRRRLEFADRICASRIRQSIAGIVEHSVRHTIGAAVTADRFIERQGRKVRGTFLRLDHRHRNCRTIVLKADAGCLLAGDRNRCRRHRGVVVAVGDGGSQRHAKACALAYQMERL